MKKPKNWKYKTGNKKGKLTTQARVYLSQELKEYHSKKPKIKPEPEIKSEPEIKIIKEVKIKIKRVRKQIVQSLHINEPPYFIDVRVSTINPDYNFKTLKLELIRFQKIIESEYNIKIKELLENQYFGISEEELGENEDLILNDNGIYGYFYLGYWNDRSKINPPLLKLR